MLLVVCLTPEKGTSVTFRHALGWIGRKKRRECAHGLARKLREALEVQDVASAMVTDIKQLDAFRDRPLSRPMNELLHRLKRRIQDELTPYHVFIVLDYSVRGGQLCHLAVEATPIRAVSQYPR